MLKKFVLAALAVSSLVVAAPQAAGAATTAALNDPCYLNCVYIVVRDDMGNNIGGYWLCPGEEYECVPG